MKFASVAAALALTIASTTSLAQDCVLPEKPTIPDGASASLEDMLAGQKAVKAFQEANVAYMGCLEPQLKAAEAAAKSAADDAKEAATAAYNTAVEAYNAAVAAEEEIAGQFNTEIREYKAANPG